METSDGYHELVSSLKTIPPCSRQGLPIHAVAGTNCGLLPHSFHPYLIYRSKQAVSFLWHFP